MKRSNLQSLNMNNNFMLQNFIESGNNLPIAGDQKLKKAPKGGNHQLELLVGTVYNEVCQLFQDNEIHIEVPEEVTKIVDKVNMLKYFIQQLVEGQDNVQHKQKKVNESGMISCVDCQNYQASLQKLQNEVRQHIRLEQQLKIFQDSIEEKIQENKKEKKDFHKKIDSQKKQIEDLKNFNTTITEKINKIEAENQQLKNENRALKRNVSTNQQGLTTKREGHKQSSYAYESKQNKIDWVHRNISVKKDDKEKEKQYERKSIQKAKVTDRNESAEKNWRMSANAKSNKIITAMNQKIIQQKTKDQRKKIIQSKFQYRR